MEELYVVFDWLMVSKLCSLTDFYAFIHFLCFRRKTQTSDKSGEQIPTNKTSSEIRNDKDQQVSFPPSIMVLIIILSCCFLYIQ